jgi:hypothetical protein
MFRPEIDETPYFDVAGRDGTLNRELEDFQHLKDSSDDEYADVEVDYSLSFHPWTSWLGMLIGSETLREFSPSNIVAHCLWEMTFHGFEKHEVQDALAELRERADEIDAMTEAEREKFLVSAAERGR